MLSEGSEETGKPLGGNVKLGGGDGKACIGGDGKQTLHKNSMGKGINYVPIASFALLEKLVDSIQFWRPGLYLVASWTLNNRN